MNCDCSYPEVYNAKIVKTRKPHNCCECGYKINTNQQAEKIDSLVDGIFSTIYTCFDCMQVRNRIKKVFAEETDCLPCHSELFEFIQHSDLVANQEFNQITVDWLCWRDGKFCLIGDK